MYRVSFCDWPGSFYMHCSSLVQWEQKCSAVCVGVHAGSSAVLMGWCFALGDLYSHLITAGKGQWTTCAAWRPPGHAPCPTDGCRFIAPLQKNKFSTGKCLDMATAVESWRRLCCSTAVSAWGSAKGQILGLCLPVKRKKEKAAEWDQCRESPLVYGTKSHSRWAQQGKPGGSTAKGSRSCQRCWGRSTGSQQHESDGTAGPKWQHHPEEVSGSQLLIISTPWLSPVLTVFLCQVGRLKPLLNFLFYFLMFGLLDSALVQLAEAMVAEATGLLASSLSTVRLGAHGVLVAPWSWLWPNVLNGARGWN